MARCTEGREEGWSRGYVVLLVFIPTAHPSCQSAYDSLQIETDHVQIITSTTLDPPAAQTITHSPHTRPASPSSPISPVLSSTALPHETPSKAQTSATPSAPSTPQKVTSPGPSYVVQILLSTTSNNGKSLLHRSRIVAGKRIAELVDQDGGVEGGEVSRWIAHLLVDAGLVGAEAQGVKEE